MKFKKLIAFIAGVVIIGNTVVPMSRFTEPVGGFQDMLMWCCCELKSAFLNELTFRCQRQKQDDGSMFLKKKIRFHDDIALEIFRKTSIECLGYSDKLIGAINLLIEVFEDLHQECKGNFDLFNFHATQACQELLAPINQEGSLQEFSSYELDVLSRCCYLLKDAFFYDLRFRSQVQKQDEDVVFLSTKKIFNNDIAIENFTKVSRGCLYYFPELIGSINKLIERFQLILETCVDDIDLFHSCANTICDEWLCMQMQNQGQ